MRNVTNKIHDEYAPCEMQMATNETDISTNLQTLNSVSLAVGAKTLSFLAMQRHLYELVSFFDILTC